MPHYLSWPNYRAVYGQQMQALGAKLWSEADARHFFLQQVPPEQAAQRVMEMDRASHTTMPATEAPHHPAGGTNP